LRNWKEVERRIARELGGERVGILGREDVRHDRYSVEVKTRLELPAFLKGAYGQAQSNAAEGKVPLLVLKEKGKRFADCLVILRFADFPATPTTRADLPQESVHGSNRAPVAIGTGKCEVCLVGLKPGRRGERKRFCSVSCRRLACSARQIEGALAEGRAEGLRTRIRELGGKEHE
jgi:hypothetical protein